MSYLEKTLEVYKEAAISPSEGLCCSTNPIWDLPGLNIPEKMISMNYGCGSTVNFGDIKPNSKVLYIGAGAGMELLKFSYFTRDKGKVYGIDPVDEMLKVCKENIQEAEKLNDWFRTDMIELKKGDAQDLDIPDNSVDVVAQNCLFNIFKKEELQEALKEVFRVLKPRGRFVLSDPICEQPMPEALREDDRLRALCLSGAIPLQEYIAFLTEIGFGTIEVRAKRPYRILSKPEYEVEDTIHIESVELAAIKDPMPLDGPCIFTGRTAIYFGSDAFFNDGNEHTFLRNQPLSICDKTAKTIAAMGRDDIFISPPTYFYDGGGCC